MDLFLPGRERPQQPAPLLACSSSSGTRQNVHLIRILLIHTQYNQRICAQCQRSIAPYSQRVWDTRCIDRLLNLRRSERGVSEGIVAFICGHGYEKRVWNVLSMLETQTKERREIEGKLSQVHARIRHARPRQRMRAGSLSVV